MPQELIVVLIQRNQLIFPTAAVKGDDLITGFHAPGIERFPGQNKIGLLELKL